MKSVADQFRASLASGTRALSIDERFEMITRLAEEDLAAFQAATGLSRADALRALTERRQAGRQRSRVASLGDASRT